MERVRGPYQRRSRKDTQAIQEEREKLREAQKKERKRTRKRKKTGEQKFRAYETELAQEMRSSRGAWTDLDIFRRYLRILEQAPVDSGARDHYAHKNKSLWLKRFMKREGFTKFQGTLSNSCKVKKP